MSEAWRETYDSWKLATPWDDLPDEPERDLAEEALDRADKELHRRREEGDDQDDV